MKVSLEKAKKYYKKGEKPVEKIVTSFLEGDEDLILHGSKAINAQLPKYLEVYTEDWDIFTTSSPGKKARQIERELDERYSGNFFEVKSSKIFRDTFGIYSRVTGRKVVDVTLYEDKVSHKKILGMNVATLDHHVDRIRDTLSDPSKKFRWGKDKEALQRIMIHTKLRGKK